MKTFLEERIKYYDNEYRAGRPLISDSQFDELERKLERIDPKCDYFNKRNNLVLPSLPKDQTNEFLKDLLPNTKLLIEPKIYGCSIAIRYIDGKFDSAINRRGKDVSRKVQAIKNIPKEIKLRSLFVVRGELFTPEERPCISKRITSGYLRSRDYTPNPKISFSAFQIIKTRKNQYENLVYLRKLGFTIPEIVEANRTSQVETFRQAWLTKNLFINYPTDGIVIKINSRKLQLLREKSYGLYHHWQMAIKN